MKHISRKPGFPKGRQVDKSALDRVRDLLGGRPRGRDLLIEHLHLIQDRYGSLSSAHLAALAAEMGLAQAEVYEVATFYAHFHVVVEDPAPAVTVRVCDGLPCEMMGAGALLEDLSGRFGAGVRVVRAPCMGRCEAAPAVEAGHRHVTAADAESVAAALGAGDLEPEIPPYTDFEAYRASGGYALFAECLNGARTADDVIGAIDESGLRGMGGAGFPTGRKLSIVRGYPGPRLMALNADEGEPGTFKDRVLMETDPHRVIEGMLIAAWAVEAEEVYVYLRDEYPGLHRMLAAEFEHVAGAGLTRATRIHLRRGAGAYICGEESAMIESIEGKRGLPRHRPPYVAEEGLFGRPTLVNNPETMYWIPGILEKGPAWYAGEGRKGCRGSRYFSVSGRVKEPGVKLAPAGVTASELIEEFSGGMAVGHTFKGYAPGGASGGILPASMSDIPLDFGTLEEHGCFIGSAAVVVFSEEDNMAAAALNLMRFFADESCGQCTPCRVGCEKAVKLMESGPWDEALLTELSAAMRDASICGLGQAAPNPLLSAFKHFPEDLP